MLVVQGAGSSEGHTRPIQPEDHIPYRLYSAMDAALKRLHDTLSQMLAFT